MSNSENSIENLMWPSKYVHKAFARARAFSQNNEKLNQLYRFTFDPVRFLGECDPIDIPFSKSLDLSAHQQFLASEQADLPLSIVTITRNDNHVERMQERTQAFIDCVYTLAETYQKNVELIIVEWNPPSERPPLKDEFNFPENHEYVSVVIITVPEYLHDQFKLANELPLYQMIGKNVGIRRARGKFVLSTNIDVLLSDELFQFMTGNDITKGKLYRSNRWDVDRKILDLNSPRKMLDEARNLCFQINYPDGVRGISDIKEQSEEDNYAEALAITHLHTWACGDFQLLHRDDWAKLTGFSELDAYSFHIDSLFCITCHYAGVSEVALPDQFPHYHIDHTLGTPVKSNTYIINEKKALYHLAYMTLLQCDYQMQQKGDYFVFNKAHWGLATEQLPIDQVCKAQWETSPLTYNELDANKLDGENIASVSAQPPEYFEELESHYQGKFYQAYLAKAYQQTADYLKSIHGEQDFLVWGAGERGKTHGTNLLNLGIQIKGFIHGTNSPHPDTLIDLPVLKASQLNEFNHPFILIASMYAEEIRAELEQSNKKEGEDYIVLF